MSDFAILSLCGVVFVISLAILAFHYNEPKNTDKDDLAKANKTISEQDEKILKYTKLIQDLDEKFIQKNKLIQNLNTLNYELQQKLHEPKASAPSKRKKVVPVAKKKKAIKS